MLREVQEDEQTEDKSIRLRALLRGASNHGRRVDRPNLFYPLLFEKHTGKFLGHGPVLKLEESRHDYIAPENAVAMWPIAVNGDELTWNLQPETLMDKHNKHFLSFSKFDGEKRVGYYLSASQEENFYKGLYNVIGTDDDGAYIVELKSVAVKDVRPLTIWHKKSHSASEYGTTYLNKIIGSNRFSFPKSLYAVLDTIRFFVADKPDAIVLDFFAGSGTTLHAVNLLNAIDGGHRACILVTNNEISVEEEKEFKKNGISKGDEAWEEHGIAKYVTWPRTVCTVNGVDLNGAPLKGNYLGTNIPMADGFSANVKFFKCDWLPRNPEDRSLAESLFEHIKEMVELENHIEVDGYNYAIILDEDQADEMQQNWSAYSTLKGIYISRSVLLTTSQNELFYSKPVSIIPDHYFNIEMREVGEAW